MAGNSNGPLPLQANPIALKAGSLSFFFDNGTLRSITNNENELVRRIYMALRDEFWNTIPGEMTNLSIEKHDASFSIEFDSHHRRGLIDFIWHCTISGRECGEIRYTMDGEAIVSFPYNRIGLCVLHPLAACKALICRIETIDSKTIEAPFPEAIAPYPIFSGIRSMRYAPPGAVAIRLDFEGDAFETEDQRNWTDATFKTYAPPLLAQPRTFIEKGTTIHRSAILTLESNMLKPVAIRRPAAVNRPPLRLDFQSSPPAGNLPSIGLMEPSDELSPRTVALLRSTKFSHLRIDLRFDRDDIASRVLQVKLPAETIGVPLEAALHFTDNSTAEAGRIPELLGSPGLAMSRFLIYHAVKRSCPAATFASAASALRVAFPSSAIVTGTDGYFVEINRVRPETGLAGGVCYAATPQVHTFDDIAVMENLPGLLETLNSCRLLFPNSKVHISPLTLRPRKNPLLPEKDGGPDPRQQTLFAAAWMVGCMAYCVEGSASSLTFGETSGPGGLIASDGSRIFPAFLPFSWLAAFGGLPAQCRLSSDPSKIIGLELPINGGFFGIIANLSNEIKSVTIGGLPSRCGVSVLDQAAYDAISRCDNPAQEVKVTEVDIHDGHSEIEMGPYALARFTEVI